MIRPATPADLALLADLESRCFGEAAWGEALLVAALAADTVCVTDAGDGYTIVRVVADTADLDRIAVVPESREHGTGRTLLAAAIAESVLRGAERVVLEVSIDNVAAIALYEAAGFAEIHRRRRYYPDGTDAVVMELRPV